MWEPALPSPSHIHSLSFPSSTAGVASPDVQVKLILPSVLEWQNFSFSYISEMLGTVSNTSHIITGMISSIYGHDWHPFCTKDIDKLEWTQDGAARRIQSKEKIP